MKHNFPSVSSLMHINETEKTQEMHETDRLSSGCERFLKPNFKVKYRATKSITGHSWPPGREFVTTVKRTVSCGWSFIFFLYSLNLWLSFWTSSVVQAPPPPVPPLYRPRPLPCPPVQAPPLPALSDGMLTPLCCVSWVLCVSGSTQTAPHCYTVCAVLLHVTMTTDKYYICPHSIYSIYFRCEYSSCTFLYDE